MELRKAMLASSSFSFVLILFLSLLYGGVKALSRRDYSYDAPLVEKSERRPLVVSEYGTVSAVDVQAGHGAPLHHLQFITLEPNSLFLPVLLHADMLLYVHTGSGRLTSADEDGTKSIDLRVGDLCKLDEGTVFHIQSNSDDPHRKKLRLYAMFANSEDHTYDPSIGAYSRVNELIKGFDKRIIQAAFKVPEDLVEAITNKSSIPGIVHSKNATSEEQRAPKDEIDLEASLLGNILGIHSTNKEKTNKHNIFKHDPDFRNRHGWTLTVTKKQLKALKHTNLGFFMVNLTAGSMLGPHWNPRSVEIAVVLYGQCMVRVLCGSSSNGVDNQTRRRECKNTRFKVEEGDVFVVPRYHPMAQMSFQNESLVFLGFTTSSKKHNNVRFLAGDTSVLQNIKRDVLATSLGVSKATVGRLLRNQNESVIFPCNSCAEEEERVMLEEERSREEEKEKEEEREEEEEEERERKRQEEEEEEARRREEEEEAARKREEEERERKRQEEEEEARRREEEERERKRQEEEEEEEARRREEEEEEARRREEEERAEEEARRERERRREEEEARRQEQEEMERERQEEERRREEAAAAAERAEEEARKERRKRREEEAARRQQEEEIERERQEEERRREFERRRKEAAEREREEQGGRPRGGGGWQREEERERRRQGGGGGYHVPVETQVEIEGRRVLKAQHV